MVEPLLTRLRRRIGRWLFKPEYEMLNVSRDAFAQRQKELDIEVNQRVAFTLSKMDPFELVMREYHGVFGEDFEHPEDRLDERSVYALRSFGYTIANDPSFIFLCEWIMNSQANETLLKAAPTPERILYGRAQLSAMLAFRKEVRRLSAGYEDMMAQNRGEEFDSTLSTE
jgi:hypothetical protein